MIQERESLIKNTFEENLSIARHKSAVKNPNDEISTTATVGKLAFKSIPEDIPDI